MGLNDPLGHFYDVAHRKADGAARRQGDEDGPVPHPGRDLRPYREDGHPQPVAQVQRPDPPRGEQPPQLPSRLMAVPPGADTTASARAA